MVENLLVSLLVYLLRLEAEKRGFARFEDCVSKSIPPGGLTATL